MKRIWFKENIDKIFDDLAKELGRTPTAKDFREKCKGALQCIIRGNYSQEIKTWNQYLEHRGIELNHDVHKWNPNEIDRAYDELKSELGRVPSSIEFRARNRGAEIAIREGRYNPEIKSWNGYLLHRGEELNQKPGGWTVDEIDKAFDNMAKEIGRTPTVTSFSEKHPGAMQAIVKGRYHPEVKNWNGYLEHRGIKMNLEIGKWTPEKIDEVFDEMKADLGRVPTYKDFEERGSGAILAITKGRYSPDVRSWNQYLIHRRIPINKPYSRNSERIEILEDLLEDESGEAS